MIILPVGTVDEAFGLDSYIKPRLGVDLSVSCDIALLRMKCPSLSVRPVSRFRIA